MKRPLCTLANAFKDVFREIDGSQTRGRLAFLSYFGCICGQHKSHIQVLDVLKCSKITFTCVCISLLRLPFDPRHSQQRGQNVHQQQPPRSPEETKRHRAQGQTGRREHDSDVLQWALKGRWMPLSHTHITSQICIFLTKK